MDLILESSNILQTRLLTSDDNQVIYSISTDYALFQPPTIIFQTKGNQNTEIGHIEQDSHGSGNVTCHGQTLAIENRGIFAR
jgi:hypothetical protein